MGVDDMNNCIWCFIYMCTGENCKCNNFLDVNDFSNEHILKEYEEEIKIIFEPIHKELKEKYLKKYGKIK